MGLPDPEKFLFTACKYLWEQGTEEDRHVAVLLSLSELQFTYDGFSYDVYAEISIPFTNFKFFTDEVKTKISETFSLVFSLVFTDDYYSFADVIISPKLEDAYEGWQKALLEGALGQHINNQASFTTKNVPMCQFRNMKFRSKSEMKLAELLVQVKNVLFFPLPLAVSGDEHKEPDFLICYNGKWAILEVQSDMYHPSVEKEGDRMKWFQNHNIPIRPYRAKECYENPREVLKDFFQWLKKL